MVVLNKTDLDPEGTVTKNITSELQKRNQGPLSLIAISAVTGRGVDKLNETLWTMVKGMMW